MSKKIKVGTSPVLMIMIGAIIISVLAFSILTVLGLSDFRSDEQKKEEAREELLSHSLINVAIRFAKNSDQLSVEKISCYKINASGNTKIYVRVDYDNGTVKCYSNVTGSIYAGISAETYNLTKRQYRILSELVVEGENLAIVFEEARNS